MNDWPRWCPSCPREAGFHTAENCPEGDGSDELLECVAEAIGRCRRARVAAGRSRDCAAADHAYALAALLALARPANEVKEERGKGLS